MTGDSSVKSGDKATYTVTLSVKNGPLKDVSLVLGGSTAIKWTGGCEPNGGLTCKLGSVQLSRVATASYTAPKVSEDTAKKLTVTVKSGTKTVATGTKSLTVEKPSSSSSPTKSPSPTKTSEKPTASHRPSSHQPSSHAPTSAPSNSGHVPLPDINPPSVPTSVPSIPVGSQPPFPNGTPTGLPRLPSVAPSPEGSPRVPNVAEPPRKASGEVRTDAVSLPAAAAAAFIGLGAGSMITRSVRRRGLLRTIGRHRD